MYHLLKGLHEYLTKKDEYSVVIIGLDNAGKTTMLERIKTMYNPTPGMPPDKIGPTVGQNIGKISLPSTTLSFFDLGGQRDIRSIWEKYYDECHAVVFVLDAGDGGRLSEGWEVFDEVLTSPRLLNLPLLLIANKQDTPGSLSVSEVRESFDAWQRAASMTGRANGAGGGAVASAAVRWGKENGNATASGSDAVSSGTARSLGKAEEEVLKEKDAERREESEPRVIGLQSGSDTALPPMSAAVTSSKGKGKLRAVPPSPIVIPPTSNPSTPLMPDVSPGPATPDATEEHRRIWSEAFAHDGHGDGGAKAERVASLDVLGASALTGVGVRELVDWLYIRVQGSRRIDRREDF